MPRSRHRGPCFRFACILAVRMCGGTASLCPETCSATVDGSSFPCRYHGNGCQVSIDSLDPSRLVDLNVAVINPYVGGLGDLMTMVEPSIAQALQDIENSSFLPGYRLNAYLVDSKCSVPDATRAAVAAMTTGPPKHVVFSDSCSAACEAVNDALQHFQVLQVSPGCVSVSLSDSDRYPYFTRMAPSFRFNVLTIYELFKFFGFERIGIVFGYRGINNLAKDLLLEMMASDNAAGTYSWTSLFTHRVEFIQDAEAAIDLAASKDSRINMMALYELEGSMLLCQAFKKNVLTPDFNWFVSSGWWNQNYITLTAGTAKVPCTVEELHRASYSLIASDRGPMLNTQDLHSLSERSLADLYTDYTERCQGFANGKGACNHQWAGYFYDGLWLIASVLHSFLIDQNRSMSELATSQSLPDLEQLSLNIDFMGQTGRVRQFNSVDPTTTPASYGDRDGTVLLRQATGAPESAFIQLAFRTEAGLNFKTDVHWSSTDTSQKLLCSGSTCDFANGWVPRDRTSQCEAGQVWSLTEGCQRCSPGSFASLGMTQCNDCSPGTFSLISGASACSNCGLGNFTQTPTSSSCFQCSEGKYVNQTGATECFDCPIGTYSNMKGLSQCTPCPPNRETAFQGASSEDMCVCHSGYQLQNGACVLCDRREICEGGRVVGLRPSNDAWMNTLDVAGGQRALSQTIAKNFFLVALVIRVDESKTDLLNAMTKFDNTLNAMMTGDENLNIIAAPNQEVRVALEATRVLWTPLMSLMTEKVDAIITSGVVDLVIIAQIEEQTNLLSILSQAVVDAWADAASTSGVQLNGLLVDIAGRQRMLIQQMCKEALVIALGVSIPQTREELTRVSSLFEETQEGLVFGIAAVGIPELRSVCTMHQMREVNYYFRQVRPYIREITNAPSNAASSDAAARVASDLANLTDPFFESMADAVVLFQNDSASCNPLETIVDSEWIVLTDSISHAQVGLQESMRYYLQIANGLAIQESKVELSVLIAEQSQLLRDLVQGQKLQNEPAPPTQQMLDKFISVTNSWSTFSMGLDEAVRQTTIPEVDVTLQINLEISLLEALSDAMDLQVQAGRAAGSTVQIELLDLTHRQVYQFHKLPNMAYEVLFGAISAEEFNATAAAFRSLHRDLIVGAPANPLRRKLANGPEPGRMALQKITDLCIIRDMAEVMENFYLLEQAALQILNQQSEAVSTINQVSPAGVAAMTSAADAIYQFYRGQTASCENVSNTKSDWQMLMSEVANLAGLVEDAMSAMISKSFNAEMVLLGDSMDRLVMGSPNPLVPVQPTQVLFNRIINDLQPSVVAFVDSVGSDSPHQTVQTNAASVTEIAKGLLQTYTDEALQADPGWPGQRVQVAMWQSVLAKRVNREALAERFDVASELEAAQRDFETAHQQLKDGGSGFAAIIDEREDLLSQWNRIGAAWAVFKASKDDENLAVLLTELEVSLPLFGIQDAESPPSVPYGFYIAYGVLGTLLLICICAAVFVARNAMKKKESQGSNQAAV